MKLKPEAQDLFDNGDFNQRLLIERIAAIYEEEAITAQEKEKELKAVEERLVASILRVVQDIKASSLLDYEKDLMLRKLQLDMRP